MIHEFEKVDLEKERVTETKKIKEVLLSLGVKQAFDGNKLMVYVDEEQNKYYITLFAASSLEFIDYNKAAMLHDQGQMLFEISSEILHLLKVIFQERLEYVELVPRYNYDRELSNDIINDSNSMDTFKYDNKMNPKEFEEMLGYTKYNNRLR